MTPSNDAWSVGAFPLAACLLLAGCTFMAESRAGPDKSAYGGGWGFALAIANEAEDPFELVLVVLGAGNEELARIEERLGPGESIEKWWTLATPSAYSARLSYTWRGPSGSTSHGFDDQTFRASECPQVSRLAWELRQSPTAVGHRYLGKTCVVDEA